jgi:hypothetical protein
MSFFFEGNGYFGQSVLTTSSVANSLVTTSTVKQCTIDMLSLTGALTNITNVADPIQPQDAATKQYVDNLGVVFGNYTLIGTAPTQISSVLSGCYQVAVKNLVSNGPSAYFIVTKNESVSSGQVVRISACPGIGTSIGLDLSWPANGYLQLSKSGPLFDGTYRIKMY